MMFYLRANMLVTKDTLTQRTPERTVMRMKEYVTIYHSHRHKYNIPNIFMEALERGKNRRNELEKEFSSSFRLFLGKY
jgi:hypothetical protein